MEEPFIVGLGTQVTLKLDFGDEVETLTVALVPDALADMYNGFLGEGTPLARAILGQAVGAVLPYQHGQVTIHTACVDELIMEKAKANAARRQEQAGQTQKEIAKANATLFSLTVESKWGDYDPDGIKW